MNSSIDISIKLKERSSTDYIVLHHSNTTRRSRCDVFDIHRSAIEDGMSCIGYHFVIEKDGTLRSGRPLNTIGSHAEGMDHTSIGVCMIGGVNKDGVVEDTFNDSQYKTLQALVILLQDIYPSATLIKNNNINSQRLEAHIR